MRHKMRQKREERLYPCLEDGRRMMRRTPKKRKNNNDNETRKIKSAPVSPPLILNPPEPQSKAKKTKAQILSNPAAGSKSIQKRDVHMCITGEIKTKQNATEKKPNQHHVMQLFIRLEAGQGMRI